MYRLFLGPVLDLHIDVSTHHYWHCMSCFLWKSRKERWSIRLCLDTDSSSSQQFEWKLIYASYLFVAIHVIVCIVCTCCIVTQGIEWLAKATLETYFQSKICHPSLLYNHHTTHKFIAFYPFPTKASSMLMLCYI